MTNKSEAPKQPMSRAQLAVWLLVGILVTVTANILLLLVTPSSGQEGERAALFGVSTITVEGNTRYDDEAIIAYSGIYVGQSIFSVDKTAAVEKIQKTFSYAEQVTIDTGDGMDDIRIIIKEATPLGVVNVGDRWMLISTKGTGLQAFEKGADAPLRYMRLEGAVIKEKTVGGQVLDDRSQTIVSTLTQELNKHKLGQLTAINIKDRTDIRVDWNNQITFLLGNDSNLSYKVAVVAATLPEVKKGYGDNARGTLNVRDYSDDKPDKKYIVFRPEGLVVSKPTTTDPTGTDPTGVGTDPTGDTPGTVE